MRLFGIWLMMRTVIKVRRRASLIGCFYESCFDKQDNTLQSQGAFGVGVAILLML